MIAQLSRAQQWEYYDRQTNLAKTRAMDRLVLIQRIERLIEAGVTKSSAVRSVARGGKASAASIWSWLRAIQGVGRHDWLAYLVPRFRRGGRVRTVEPGTMDALAADYLRADKPSWSACVRRAALRAERRGERLPHARTLWRRLVKHYGYPEIAMRRGENLPAWLRARLPANDR
ncbi:MAG: DNA-binding domain-containing protein [Aureliella sp.]